MSPELSLHHRRGGRANAQRRRETCASAAGHLRSSCAAHVLQRRGTIQKFWEPACCVQAFLRAFVLEWWHDCVQACLRTGLFFACVPAIGSVRLQAGLRADVVAYLRASVQAFFPAILLVSLRGIVLQCRLVCVHACLRPCVLACVRASVQSFLRDGVLVSSRGCVEACLCRCVRACRRDSEEAFLRACVQPCLNSVMIACLSGDVVACKSSCMQACLRACVLSFRRACVKVCFLAVVLA